MKKAITDALKDKNVDKVSFPICFCGVTLILKIILDITYYIFVFFLLTFSVFVGKIMFGIKLQSYN